MKRGVRRDPFRKRKFGGRAKKVREPTAVNSFYREASLPSVWASLRLREMVRSGSRPGQVLSSGRHTGPAKLTNGKKATYIRKISRFNADSGYSIHSDSESQAETVHGLDGCASLLRDILRNEDSGSETAYLENRSNSRPLEGKRYGSKKKRCEKHTIPLVVQKETSSSDNKKQIPNEVSARSERDTSDLEQNWSLQDHYRMYSPIIYQALCEHVQTQMSLMNDLTSKNIPNGIPAVPCHALSHAESQATPHSSYGLCTSTPVWSPQRPPCPPQVHSEVQTDGDSQFASQEDSEIQRLVTEMEACISVLPAVSGNTDIQVEIALAMQPLRSENAQLRRQLRILNQQLREQEKTHKPSGAVDCNLELFSLQSLNMSLQSQLEESLKSQELLQSKNEELLKVIENQKDENKKFTSIFKDKDQTILENKQQYDIEITRIKIELEEALVNVRSSQFKLETAEKENQILGITLRQRDAEVTRLRELTRTLQTSMAKLLSDLSVDSARCKPGNNLTKSLLNIHDKQLQHDPAPAHTSIMSYLNKLETNYSFTHSEPLSTIKNEETIEPDKPYESVLSSRSPQNSNTRGMEEVSAPGVISALSKQDSDEGSETMALIEDEHNLDNTIYIPFARSTSEKKSSLSKRLSPQPQIRAATTQLVSNSGLAASGKENKLCTPVVCSSSTKETEDAPEKLYRVSDIKDTQLLNKIKEAIDKIPAATKEPEEQTACHGPSCCLSNSLQVKGNTVCDGSVFTSDLISDWSISSFSTFTSRDEQDFRNGLAALDANIARLQKSLRTGLLMNSEEKSSSASF
ncbi:coiled-coil domain-containing protein 14 isoform X4 [Piliocolobus tephrosceles]|uniref:coiled-coil domain-containing protein 14 isoform X4 n=1 Tax=Piliocolobus tephrosceles TaxID=591936 RepID=UPI000E6B3FC1|nr:coiled-coil domain-containing protein 14 isoform X4 [Piliocolobus tephrosceles]